MTPVYRLRAFHQDEETGQWMAGFEKLETPEELNGPLKTRRLDELTWTPALPAQIERLERFLAARDSIN